MSVWPQLAIDFDWASDAQTSYTVFYGPHERHSKWHFIPSNGLNRVHQCDRHTDRQTTLRRYVTI